MPKLLKPSQEGKHLCLFFIMGKLRHKCVKCFWQTLQDVGGKIPGVQQAASTPPRSIPLSEHPWPCTERENSSEELRAKTSHCTRSWLV